MREENWNGIKVIHHDFPESQYFQEKTDKKQVYLHHTVSGGSNDDSTGADGDIAWWKQTPERVATCIIITRDGTIHTLYSSEHWAHHLGVKSWIFKKFNISSYGANKKLNQKSLGIELDSWGGIVKRDGKFYRIGDKEIPADRIYDCGREIRGFRYYEKYTDAQIESTRQLLLFWNDKYNIPLDYKDNMWELNENALKGEPGVWSHVSVRPDKSDLYPDPQMIEMLKNLK